MSDVAVLSLCCREGWTWTTWPTRRTSDTLTSSHRHTRLMITGARAKARARANLSFLNTILSVATSSLERMTPASTDLRTFLPQASSNQDRCFRSNKTKEILSLNIWATRRETLPTRPSGDLRRRTRGCRPHDWTLRRCPLMEEMTPRICRRRRRSPKSLCSTTTSRWTRWWWRSSPRT